MSEIQLRLVNQGGDLYERSIVIFQKTVSGTAGDMAVAWRVFEFLGAGQHQPIPFPLDVRVAAGDAYSSQTPEQPATPGQAWDIVDEGGCADIRQGGQPPPAEVIEVYNRLHREIAARILRDGRLLALQPLLPNETALFQFPPRIYVGLASGVREGEVMDAALVNSIQATEIDLTGVASADIVLNPDMTFTVENVIPL